MKRVVAVTVIDGAGNAVTLPRPPEMICDECCASTQQWHGAPIAVYCEHGQGHGAMWSALEQLWLVQEITRAQFDLLPEAYARRRAH